MSEESAAGQFITAVFQAWQEAGIPYVVLRNYENLPQAPGNDIDVLVEKSQLREAEKLLICTAEKCGYRLHLRAEYATLALYFSETISNSQLHFDLFSGFTWRGIPYLNAASFLQERISHGVFFVPQPAQESACNLLSSLVHTGKLKSKYQAAIRENFRSDESKARAALAATCGPELAERIVGAVIGGRWTEVEGIAKTLRYTIVRREVFSHPIGATTAALSDVWRVANRFFQPPGRVLVLCGPDGCGKTTVGPAIASELSRTFSPDKSAHFHWKPGIVSGGRQAKHGPATDPHGKPPRNTLLSLAYFTFHWFEFFLGWHLRVRPKLFRGGLVQIDRWYYDFLVDLRRYRLKVPASLVRLGLVLLSKPDFVILLDAPPEVLRRRKQEVPEAETCRQRDAYLKVVQDLENGLVIDASQTPDRVVDDCCRRILKRMQEKCE
jgi:thymidylate kinase